MNKLNTKAVLRWSFTRSEALSPAVRFRLQRHLGHRLTRSGDIILSSDKHRERRRNRDECLEKLERMVSAALRQEKPRRPTKASKAAIERRLDAKKAGGLKKARRRRVSEED